MYTTSQRGWRIHFRRRMAYPLCAAALAATAFSSAAAQRPLVMVHGLASNSSTWDAAVQRLQTDFGSNIAITRPNLPSLTQFENQADSLIGATSPVGSNAISIAHSNGGIVSRTASLYGRAWSGVITVGTPHVGAALAANALNGALFDEGANLATATASPFEVYSHFYPDEWAWQVAYYLGYGVWSVGAALPGAGAALGYIAGNSVLPEMVPGSAFFTGTLNSTTNLARESSVIPQRIGIQVTVHDSYGLFFHAIGMSNYQNYANGIYAAAAAYYFAGDYYNNYDDYSDPYYYDKQANAYLWYDGGDALYYFDQNWCSLVNAVNPYYQCVANDGIVPYTAQAYPGGTHAVGVVGPSHVEETSDAGVIVQIENQLNSTFGVPMAGSTGTSNAFPVSISGPTLVSGCTGATWTATPNGGTAPYTYSWSVENGTYDTGTSNQLYYTNSGVNPSIFIKVTATDAAGLSGASSSFKANVSLPGAC